MNKQSDFYLQLGVNKTATKDDIRAAFMLQAKKWHPDKAPQDKKEEYEKRYTDLKKAYQMLINDKTRKQYDDALSNTFKDLRGKKRDVAYLKSDKYTTVNKDGKEEFDHAAFAADFNKSREGADTEEYQKLQNKYNNNKAVTNQDVNDFLKQRMNEVQDIHITQVNFNDEDGKFDRNAFNRMFDHQKKMNPENSVQEFTGEPTGLFGNSTGLMEDSGISGIHMSNGVGFTGNMMSTMVQGSGVNPAVDISVDQFREGGVYGYEVPDTNDDLKKRMEDIQREREQLLKMDKSDYKVEKSEIEQQYSELFQTTEGIESSTKSESESKSN